MRRNPGNITVRPILADKILERICRKLPLKPKVVYTVPDWAVISLTNVMMQTDAQYLCLTKRLDENTGKKIYYFDIPVNKKTRTRKGHKHSLFPDFYFSISLSELLKSYCGKPVNIKDFMGTNWNYNKRIINNTSDLLSTLNPPTET